MLIEYRKIGEVFPYENNPRNNESGVEAVAESIKQFGWQQPIVIDKDSVIIAGHTRWEAAQRLGLDEVPVVVADELTDEQVTAYRLADNKTGELTGWDFLALDEELDKIINIDMTDFGFDVSEAIDDVDVKDFESTGAHFGSQAIIQKMVDGWRAYTLDEFVANIIDEPTAMYQYDRLRDGYNDGYNISLLFNPHRLDTETHSKKSIFWAWNNDEKYRRELARFIVSQCGGAVPISQYYKFIGIGSGGYQYCNEFQPYLARDIYSRFVKDGDRVLDPCAGWGGRLLGFSACDFERVEYIHVEPSTKTYSGLVKLKQWLSLGDEIKQINAAFEDAELDDDSFDFVFTSPPYYDTEKYSDEETQSYKVAETYDGWRDGWLYPFIDKILQVMKDGGRCLLNVGKARYPIDSDIRNYLKQKDIKFENCDDYRIGGSGIGSRAGEHGEPFILFYK